MLAFILLAAEAAPETTASPDGLWAWVAAILGGALGMRLIQWVADFLSGKARTGLDKLAAASDKTALGGSVHIDNVLLTAISNTLDQASGRLPQQLKNALADGKLTKEEREQIAKGIWGDVVEIMQGDLKKYVADYGKEDGAKLVELVMGWWAAKRKASGS